jgi:hypothetical protein
MNRKDRSMNTITTRPSSIFGRKGMMAGLALIIGITALLIIAVAVSNPGMPAAVPPQDCGRNVTAYVNANLVQAGSTAELGAVTEKSGVYQIMIRYQGRDIPLYATKDCTLLFLNPIELTGNQSIAAQPQPTAAPAKSSRPEVDLFVMAFCPYGTQAESAMQPVADLLGNISTISVRYIASVQGTTVDSVSSLHGPSEAKEDLRQLCIREHYPRQFWPYVIDFNRDCYPISQNASLLDACWKNTTQGLGIDARKVETCAYGGEGLALLKVDGAISAQYHTQASPTLIINGQIYSGRRTPEAYKQAICSHFDTVPAECNVTLPDQLPTASSGGCG